MEMYRNLWLVNAKEKRADGYATTPQIPHRSVRTYFNE